MIIPRASPLLPALASCVVGAVILSSAWGLHQLLWARAYERTAATEEHFLNRDAFILEARIRSRVNDLYLLKGIAEDALRRTPDIQSAVNAIRPAAEKLILTRDVYDQIRLLNPVGHEILRLDRHLGTNTTVVEVAASESRDRSSRPYYTETRAAAPDDAVFSPFDFEIEHGGESIPRKPVVRVSSQVIDASGRLAALLVLNIDGRSIVTPRQYTPRPERTALLLDHNGFWLVGTRPESEWAFLHPEREKESMKDSEQDVWNRINAATSGNFWKEDTLFCFRHVDPTAPAASFPALPMPLVHAERVKWILLKRIPKEEIWAELGTARKTLWACTALALVFALPATWIGVRAFRQRDLMRLQLDKLVQSYLHGMCVLEAIQESKGGPIVDFKLMLANQAADEIFGTSLTQNIGSRLLASEPETAQNGVFETFRQIALTGESETFESKRIRNGEERWMLLKVAKFNNGLIVNIVDITERRLNEEKLRQSEHLLQMASRMSKLGAWRIEYPEQKIFWSREAYAIHEVSEDFKPEMDSAMSFFPASDQARLTKAIESCEKYGTPYDLELKFITAKGNQLWVRSMGEAVFENGVVRTLFCVLEDITEVKMALAYEQELSRSAKAAERAKANFLAVMSHEIRTPMNGILGFADMLAHRPLDEEDKESVRIIKESGQTLLRVLDDILDYSRIESGRLQIEQRQSSPAQLVEQTRVLLASLVRHRTVTLDTEVADDIPANVLLDTDRTRQILVNLAGNALKFTEKGSVTIGVRLGGNFDTPYTGLQFYVRDTGIGIAQDKLEHIFEPFTQADNSISRRYGGSGLGLAISRSLAHLMHGELTAESTLGSGSIFTLTIPVEIVSAMLLPDSPNKDFTFDKTFAISHPLKILVAEDDAINLKLIGKLLQKLGYQPVSASNGCTAVELCQANPPDCVFMDIHMPELDGLGATRQIRAWEKTAGLAHRIFIAALTADVLPDDRARTIQAGVDDYLTKPINLASLARALKEAADLKNHAKTSG